MIFTIAKQNLLHDKIRLVVTLTGIVFAVALITIQLGIFIGFTQTISAVIDNSQADVWVTSPGVKNFDIALPLTREKYYEVLSAPGVKRAAKFIIQFADWKKPDGGQESIELIGYETNKGMGGPWNIVGGAEGLLDLRNGVIADQLYMEKLGVEKLGDKVEINNRQARVVGFTRGIRSFTTSPFVFASFQTAYTHTHLNQDQFTYILAKGENDLPPTALKESIIRHTRDVDAYTTEEFSRKTQGYWMFNTGAGTSILMAAFLGLVVGTVVVAQTLYATTLEHIAEYATLKAMGAPNTYICGIIILQAILSAIFGYGFGICISYMVASLSQFAALAIIIPKTIAIGMFFLTVVMCVCSSLISIRKVMTLDPALVFKGR